MANRKPQKGPVLKKLIGPSQRATILRRIAQLKDELQKLETVLRASGGAVAPVRGVGAPGAEVFAACRSKRRGLKIGELYERLPHLSEVQVQDALRRLHATGRVKKVGRPKRYLYVAQVS